ncbi:hypothetical protein [Paenibacillus solani]|nr:hypothetical protein [Paenibacillus solani]
MHGICVTVDVRDVNHLGYCRRDPNASVFCGIQVLIGTAALLGEGRDAH